MENLQKKRWRPAAWIPAIVIMIIIFHMSNQPAAVSDVQSLGVTGDFIYFLNSVLHLGLSENMMTEQALTLNYIIRKIAHMAEYGGLAFFLAFPLWVYGIRGRKLFWLPILLAALYGATDEIHQIFIPGRGAHVYDVAIDAAGALIGMLVFWLIRRILRRIITLRHQTPA